MGSTLFSSLEYNEKIANAVNIRMQAKRKGGTEKCPGPRPLQNSYFWARDKINKKPHLLRFKNTHTACLGWMIKQSTRQWPSHFYTPPLQVPLTSNSSLQLGGHGERSSEERQKGMDLCWGCGRYCKNSLADQLPVQAQNYLREVRSLWGTDTKHRDNNSQTWLNSWLDGVNHPH